MASWFENPGEFFTGMISVEECYGQILRLGDEDETFEREVQNFLGWRVGITSPSDNPLIRPAQQESPSRGPFAADLYGFDILGSKFFDFMLEYLNTR